MPIYGSDRIGTYNPPSETNINSDIYILNRSYKRYELKDHLGNVRVTVSDSKRVSFVSETLVFSADIKTYTDYYAFGMEMVSRNWSEGEAYRQGFNGKENDKDFGEGVQDYGMRVSDTQTCRFFSVDPITAQYPELTPYQFASNTPIAAIDLDGCEARPNIFMNYDISAGKPRLNSTPPTDLNQGSFNSKSFIKDIIMYLPARLVKRGRDWFYTPSYITYLEMEAEKESARRWTDTNEKTMDWGDLTNIWYYELESDKIDKTTKIPTIRFDGGCNLTKELSNQANVQALRNRILERISKGETKGIDSQTKHFGMDDAYKQVWPYIGNNIFYSAYNVFHRTTYSSVKNLDLFLGTYTINASFNVDNSGKYTITYESVNASGWESATRFLPDRQGIVKDKPRGTFRMDMAYPLGGNVNQKFEWKETGQRK